MLVFENFLVRICKEIVFFVFVVLVISLCWFVSFRDSVLFFLLELIKRFFDVVMLVF